MTRVPAVMIQGTGSNVGKSLLVAGLCRHFARQGLSVRPFKPQNMSNNAAAVEGGEIGRAQALQARAARATANVHMNPVLLKPENDRRSQVIVQGQRFGELDASRFRESRASLLPYVLESFDRLARDADLVVGGGRRQPGRDQPASGRHRQYGLRPSGRRAGDPRRRYRPRRRHREPRRTSAVLDETDRTSSGGS